jgi:hypothetical protein
MNGRKVGVALAGVVMAVSGWYVFVYLYRWEWNRAIVAGIIFLAAEIGLLGAALVVRLSKLGHRMDELDRRDAATEERVLRQLRAHPSEPANPFAWMDGTHTNVFIPVLLGAGAVLSALAWVVDRIARATAGPGLDKRLARQLSSLHPLPGGLLGEAPVDPYRPR